MRIRNQTSIITSPNEGPYICVAPDVPAHGGEKIFSYGLFQTVTTILRTAVQAPRMNAICERLISTLRRELTGRTLILNRADLRLVLAEYQRHYNTRPPPSGISQRVPGGLGGHPAGVGEGADGDLAGSGRGRVGIGPEQGQVVFQLGEE